MSVRAPSGAAPTWQTTINEQARVKEVSEARELVFVRRN
jgi:hypothetical protein